MGLHTAPPTPPPAHVAPAASPQAAPIAAPPMDPSMVIVSAISIEYQGRHVLLAAPNGGVPCLIDALQHPSMLVDAQSRVAELHLHCDKDAQGVEVLDGSLAPPQPPPVTASTPTAPSRSVPARR